MIAIHNCLTRCHPQQKRQDGDYEIKGMHQRCYMAAFCSRAGRKRREKRSQYDYRGVWHCTVRPWRGRRGQLQKFKPTIEQVKHYLSKAYPVEQRIVLHDDYSPCYAKGDVVFSDKS